MLIDYGCGLSTRVDINIYSELTSRYYPELNNSAFSWTFQHIRNIADSVHSTFGHIATYINHFKNDLAYEEVARLASRYVGRSQISTLIAEVTQAVIDAQDADTVIDAQDADTVIADIKLELGYNYERDIHKKQRRRELSKVHKLRPKKSGRTTKRRCCGVDAN
jgi:hypothetical protein